MSQKKNKNVNYSNKTAIAKHAPVISNKQDRIAFSFLFLYSIIEFIPAFDGGDPMGAQWVYISLLNICCSCCLLFVFGLVNSTSTLKTFKSKPIWLILFILMLAFVSIFFSINKSEALVNIARLGNTAIMLINLTFLLFNRLHLLKWLSFLFSIYLFIQSIEVISLFYKGLEEGDISRVIFSLKGNAGNKNILAASLVIKIPFVIWCIHRSHSWFRFIYAIPLCTGAFAVFLLNSRASYLSLLIILLLQTTGIFFLHTKRERKHLLSSLGLIIFPVALAFMLSSSAIRNGIKESEISGTPYGTVIDRLNTISLTAEGSNSRTKMWSSAISYIKENPIMGCGYGNWKIASIPYEKSYADEFQVAYHSHNDFLEITTELGIGGGLAYLAIFFFIGFCFLRYILNKKEGNEKRFVAIVFLSLLTVYCMDAVLNFPLERPVMQFFFAFIAAAAVSIFHTNKNTETASQHSGGKIKNLYGLICTVILLPSLYITYNTYQSFLVQKKVNQELRTGNLQMKFAEVDKSFPSLPTINAFGYPVDAIRGIYLTEEKQYEKAITYFNKGIKDNPFLPLAQFYKGRIFLETNRLDSAALYAEQAFYTRPRSRSSYELLNDIHTRRNDTAGLRKAFNEYILYRNEPWAWNRYIEINSILNQPPALILALIEDGLTFFPDDQALLQKKGAFINQGKQQDISVEQEAEYQNEFAAGLDMFSKKMYTAAIAHFSNAAAAKPSDYVAVENIGVNYYAAGNYKKALEYLKKVLSNYSPVDGKAEMIAGLCLLNLSDKTQGCMYLQKATLKNNQEAKIHLATYCR